MIRSKPLDESTKMSRLLQLLEGAPLSAVKRYETIPGGLDQAMKLLEERYGQQCQIVRACVDSLTKGPIIAPNDKQGLRKYADEAQVVYDTLKYMDGLSEMNVDNLEKIVLRLPKWAQGKFGEYLKKIERDGSAMPTFRHIVDFLKDRADVANHPFFSKPLGKNQEENGIRGNPRRTGERRTILSTYGNNPEISKD